MQRVEPGYLLLALCPQLTSLAGSGASGKGNGSIFLKCVVFAALLFLGLVAVAHWMICYGEARRSFKK